MARQFTLHNSSILGNICDRQTLRSDSTFSLDLCSPKSNGGVFQNEKKDQHLYCCSCPPKKKVNTCIAVAIVSLVQFIVRLELVLINFAVKVNFRDSCHPHGLPVIQFVTPGLEGIGSVVSEW